MTVTMSAPIAEADPLRQAVREAYRMDEDAAVAAILAAADLPSDALDRIAETARRLWELSEEMTGVRFGFARAAV